jgi:ribose-phosphate pyrophosphokinase
MLTINGIPLESSFKFPGGEVQVRVPLEKLKAISIPSQKFVFTIKTILNSSESIMELIMVKSVMDSHFKWNIKNLIIDYFPFARQDRACYPGEAESAKVFIELLHSLKFNEIFTTDVHNPEIFYTKPFDNSLYLTPDIFWSRINHKTSADIFRDNPRILENISYLLAPDAGAFDKVATIADDFELGFFSAEKIRNPDTGKIDSIKCNGDISFISGEDIMIVDDICDGGATFISLVKELLPFDPNSITLYVTHGIFSRGIDTLLRSGIDKVITTDSFFQEDHYHKFCQGWGFGESSVNYLKSQGKFHIIEL